MTELRRNAAGFLKSVGLALFTTIAVSALPAEAAATTVEACDHAAASPFDGDVPASVTGVDIKKADAERAIQLCTDASRAVPGEPRIALELGRAFEAKGDIEAARNWYEKSSSFSYAAGFFHLAKLLKQSDKAEERINGDWYRRLAANRGNRWAQRELADRYYQDNLIKTVDERKLELAGRYFKLAADQGDVGAQFFTGAYFEYGASGFPQDDREAVRYYQRSAKGGSSDALIRLSEFYKSGRGGLPRDLRESERLAQSVDPPSRPFSGEDFVKGLGTSVSRVLIFAPLMRKANGNAGSSRFTPGTIVDLTSRETREVQQMLSLTEDYKGAIDGALNSQTLAAIRAFKYRNHFPPDELRSDEFELLVKAANEAISSHGDKK